MSEKQIRVLIADDQRLMREGLCIILEDAEDMEVIGEAENGLTAIELSESLHPDVILMDIRMPLPCLMASRPPSAFGSRQHLNHVSCS